jgi:hypothetical protein
MKHKGSVSQTYIERDHRVLPDLIRRAKHLATYPTTSKKLFRIAAELPTEKFYITDDAAIVYVSKRHIHNITPQFANPFKKRLFDALYEEVVKMMKCEEYSKMGLKYVTLLALSRPAPCVGLAPRGIENRISKIRCKKNHE